MRALILTLVVAGVCALLPLTGCQKKEPVRIGFVGGLTGRVADLGVAGRNGAMLAVEEANAAGGIGGRQVELVVRDDQQNPEALKRSIADFVSNSFEVVIGPMTSSMAVVAVPLVNGSKTLLISPTVTTTELSGMDDNFLRVISTTKEYSEKNAVYQFDKVGHRRVAVIYDLDNRSYSEDWFKGFRTAFEGRGGSIAATMTYRSAGEPVFTDLAAEMLKSRPDLVLIIANAVDAAMICQQLRKLNKGVGVAVTEWGSTERFIELAGPAADGVVAAQFLNRSDSSPRYARFHESYLKRFGQEPGFAGVAGYDATIVALEAFAKRSHGQSLKEYIIATSTFQGVQQPIVLDRFGDADRKSYLTLIRNGRFVTLD
ncbi:MAG TPA: ABC transporter substrate-binding protein [Desulfuromonadaceae bacterium]